MLIRHIFRRARFPPLRPTSFRQPSWNFSTSRARAEIEKFLDSGEPLEATLDSVDPPDTPIEKPTEDAGHLEAEPPLEATHAQKASKPHEMNPVKTIIDWMSPQPALRHAALLKDILPTTRGPNDKFASGKLPSYSHGLKPASPDFLVYWPLQAPPSQLAPDGADKDHVPSGYSVAGPHEPPGQGLRLWKSGRLIFRYIGAQSQPLGFYKKQQCIEARYADKTGQESHGDVTIHRIYKDERRDGSLAPVITERRTLRFVKDRVAERILRAAVDDVQGEEASPVDADHAHDFTTTPAQLFQFSALTFNAHYIHLDPKNGLVHGPLLQALMLRVAEQHIIVEAQPGIRLRRFEYDCIRPLKVGQEARVCFKKTTEEAKWRVWVERRDGRLIAEGLVHARPHNVWHESLEKKKPSHGKEKKKASHDKEKKKASHDKEKKKPSHEAHQNRRRTKPSTSAKSIWTPGEIQEKNMRIHYSDS